MDDADKILVSGWVKTLLTNLGTRLDPQQVKDLLEACGRECGRTHAAGRAKLVKEKIADIDNLLDTLNASVIGGGHLHRVDDHFTVTFEACYCPLVQAASEKLPESFCNCSRGWVKEMFVTLLDRPVEVEILQTVRRGAESCEFVVR